MLTRDGDGVPAASGLVEPEVHKHCEGALAGSLHQPPRLVLRGDREQQSGKHQRPGPRSPPPHPCSDPERPDPLPQGSASAHLHRCLRPWTGGFDLCRSRWASGWAGPRRAGWCSRYCPRAAGRAPPQESAGGEEQGPVPGRGVRRGRGKGAGRRGPTHALDHHGAAPVGGLSPGYLLHVVDHHGADAVRVSVAATGERAVSPRARPATEGGHRPERVP